jgi:hypothetical protein
MLMAFKDGEFKIKDVPSEDAGVRLHSIETRPEAVEILKWAKGQRSDVKWIIVGKGPYGIRGRIL